MPTGRSPPAAQPVPQLGVIVVGSIWSCSKMGALVVWRTLRTTRIAGRFIDCAGWQEGSRPRQSQSAGKTHCAGWRTFRTLEIDLRQESAFGLAVDCPWRTDRTLFFYPAL